MNKPLSVARKEYMDAICAITNQSGLPAFVILEVIERLQSQLEKLAQEEQQRDQAMWEASRKKDAEEEKESGD